MPSKFIKQGAWEKIERLTVKAVIELNTPINDTKVLEYVVEKGLASLTVADVRAAMADRSTSEIASHQKN